MDDNASGDHDDRIEGRGDEMTMPLTLLRVWIGLLSLVALLGAEMPSAAAQAGVNGGNASAVDFGQSGRKLGEYRQSGPRQWVETNAAGAVTFRFEERQRDEWSVYLTDPARGVNIQLDLNTRKVVYSDKGSPRRVLYDILNARSQPAAVAAAPPAPAAPPSTADIAQRAIFGASDPDICWKESYGRGAGTVPDACPQGFERTGADLLCYPICKAGFSGVGPVCWQACPAGFRNDGAFCGKPEAYGRGVGFAYAPIFESRDTARERCEREHGAGNCERNLEMYYPVCKAGFKEFGSNVCTPVCPSGMTDIGVSCAKPSYGRGVGEGATCKVGMQQDFKGGLCYPNCRPGTTGVGPLCWNGCPAAFPVNCGAACGVSQSACAFAIIEQVQSTADVALNVAALVATAGAATPALRAAQSAGRSARRTLTKTARDQLKEQAKNQLQNAMKWQKRGKQIARGQGYLDDASNLNQASELLVTSYEKGEFDFMSLAPSVADVEPTGVLAVVNSFNKPICR